MWEPRRSLPVPLSTSVSAVLSLLRSGVVAEDGNIRCRVGKLRRGGTSSDILIKEGKTVGDDWVMEGVAKISPREMSSPLQRDIVFRPRREVVGPWAVAEPG